MRPGVNSTTGSSDAASNDFCRQPEHDGPLPGYSGGAADGTAFAAYAASLIGSGAQGTAVANAPARLGGTGTTCP